MIAFIHANAVYDLDHLRHFMAWGFNPGNWFTNASEQMIAFVVVAVIGTLIWPRMRHAFEGWFDRKIVGHLEVHHKKMAELLEGHMAELHSHIDSATTKE